MPCGRREPSEMRKPDSELKLGKRGITLLSKQQRTAGMVLLAIGAYVIYYTLTKLKLGTVQSPGSGFFTFICGLGILLLSTVLVAGQILEF